MFFKRFFSFAAFTASSAFSKPYLYPGYLNDGVSPSWAIGGYKWSVSIDKKKSNVFFEPFLYITCYPAQTPQEDSKIDISLYFEAHPRDPKPSYAYGPIGWLKLWGILESRFIDRPVKAISKNVSIGSNLVRLAISVLVNEKYQMILDQSPDTRKWLIGFLQSKELKVQGRGIDITVLFYHQDLDAWLKETLARCP